MQPTTLERTARWAVVFFLLLAVVTLAFALGWGVNGLTDDDDTAGASTGGNGGSTVKSTEAGATVDEVCALLQAQYVEKSSLTPEQCKQAAIDGIITSLNDPHTTYLSPEDLSSGALDLNSTYQGIGASVTDRNGVVEIVTPFRDSPAEKAGIRAGDIILAVDGEPTDGWSDQEAVERIRGTKGTEVTLKVKHRDGATEDIVITRGDIEIESVHLDPNLEPIPGEASNPDGTYRLVDRDGKDATDIGYVAISQFHEETLNELRAKLRDVESKGYKGLVVDLRGNPGGLLTATVDVADEFLDGGVVLSEVDANGKTDSWNARSGGIATKIKIVVLQDQGSASGAEVLAAALRDNGRATIVGTRSFGKGTVNQLQRLKNCPSGEQCGALYLSVGRWLTPKGDQIEGLGVKPDVELEMTYDQYIAEGDIQLFKAIDILRGN